MRSLFICLAIGALTLPAIAQEAPVSEIFVSGEAEIQVMPDAFIISGAMNARAETRPDALTELSAAINLVQDKMPRLEGLNEAEIVTSDVNIFSIWPNGCAELEYGGNDTDNPYPDNCDPIQQYASVNIQIIGSPATSAGDAISLASELGFDNLEIAKFIVRDEAAANARAESEAVNNAIQKANRLAIASNNKLGRILAISDGNSFNLMSWEDYSGKRQRVTVTGSLRNVRPTISLNIQPKPETFEATVKLRVEMLPAD